jgi:hypothetical protein
MEIQGENLAQSTAPAYCPRSERSYASAPASGCALIPQAWAVPNTYFGD